MTKAYTTNYREKTGNTSGEEPVYLLEITHPQLSVPVRVVRDTLDLYRGVHLQMPGSRLNYASTPSSPALQPAKENLLTRSEEINLWTQGNVTVTVNQAADALGNLTLEKIETAVASNPTVYRNIGEAGWFNGVQVTGGIELRAGNVTSAVIQLYVNGGGGVIHTNAVILSGPGAVSGVGTSAITVTGLSPSQVTLIAITGTPAYAVGTLALYVKPPISPATIGDYIFAGRARLNRGATLHEYQRTLGGIEGCNLRIIWRGRSSDWTPASVARVMCARYHTASLIGLMFAIQTNGRPIFYWSPQGTGSLSAAATAAPPVVDGAEYAFRVDFIPDDGAGNRIARFFYSIDFNPVNGSGAWSQIGADVVAAGATLVYAPDQRFEIGAFQNGTASSPGMWIGEVEYVGMFDGLDGTRLMSEFYPGRDAVPGATSFISKSTGESYTIHQSGTPAAQIEADETYIAMDFDIQLPDDMQGKLPRAPLSIDNVGKELTQWLDASKGGRGAQVRVMQVMRDDPDTIEYDVTMDLLNVVQNAARVTGELGYEDTLNLPALGMTYRPDNTSGLF